MNTYEMLEAALDALDDIADWNDVDREWQSETIARTALQRIRGGDGRPPSKENTP